MSSVTEYTTRFLNTVGQITNMNELDQIENYIEGLKPVTKKELRIKNPQTMAEAIEAASNYDSAVFGYIRNNSGN